MGCLVVGAGAAEGWLSAGAAAGVEVEFVRADGESLHRASCLTRRWSIARRIAQAAVLSRAQHAPIRTRMTTLHPGWMAAQGRSCGHREPSGRRRAGWEWLQGKHPLVTGSSTGIGFVASDPPDMRPHGGYYVWLSLASGWTAATTS